MMQSRELELLIRDHAEQIDAAAPHARFEDLVGPLGAPERRDRRPRVAGARGPMVAFAAAAAVLLLVGGGLLAFRLLDPDRFPAVDRPTPTAPVPVDTAAPQPTLAPEVVVPPPAPTPALQPEPPAAAESSMAPEPVLALPLEWTRVDLGMSVELTSVVGGPAGFVAAGTEDYIDEFGVPLSRRVVMASPEGESWTVVPDPGWSDVRGLGGFVPADLLFGGGRYVALLRDEGVLYSTDGMTWLTADHVDDVLADGASLGPESLGLHGRLEAVAHGNGRYLAVGELVEFSMTEEGRDMTGMSRAAWTSDDAVTWTRSPAALEGIPGGTSQVYDVAFGPGGFVAVGSTDFWDEEGHWWSVAAFWQSPDGITWSRITQDDATFGNSSVPSDDLHGAGAVTDGDAGYVAVGFGESWHSLDGTTWTRGQTDIGYSVGHGNGVYVAVGWTAINDEAGSVIDGDAVFHYSTDGLTWTQVAPDAELFSRTDACGDELVVRPDSVAYANGRFIVTGHDSWLHTESSIHPCAGDDYTGYVWIGEPVG